MRKLLKGLPTVSSELYARRIIQEQTKSVIRRRAFTAIQPRRRNISDYRSEAYDDNYNEEIAYASSINDNTTRRRVLSICQPVMVE